MKNMPRKTRESLLILLPTRASRAIPVHMAYAHHMWFPCMWLIRISCGLCDSNMLLIHLCDSTRWLFFVSRHWDSGDLKGYKASSILQVVWVERNWIECQCRKEGLGKWDLSCRKSFTCLLNWVALSSGFLAQLIDLSSNSLARDFCRKFVSSKSSLYLHVVFMYE